VAPAVDARQVKGDAAIDHGADGWQLPARAFVPVKIRFTIQTGARAVRASATPPV
jgi:hypothetical protein